MIGEVPPVALAEYYLFCWPRSLNICRQECMLKTGGTFTGDITMSAASIDLGTNRLKFTSGLRLGRIMTPTIMDTLYIGTSTSITISALSSYVTSTNLTPTLVSSVTTSTLSSTQGSYMLKTGGTFTGEITTSGASIDQGTNSLKFTQGLGFRKIMTPTILKHSSSEFLCH